MEQVRMEDFRMDGFVSIWLGGFSSEEELDEYLDHEFKGDFGFTINAPAAPEAGVEEKPISVRILLGGYSFSTRYINAAVEKSEQIGITEATSAIVFHGFKYDPKYINSTIAAPIKFIGAFQV